VAKATAHTPTPKATREELHQIADWLFAILRFAVTREQTDRASVIIAARQLDRPGASFREMQFGFFVRTSIEFCDAIASDDPLERRASLRRQMKAIEDARLRRAFEAILEIDQAETPARRSLRRNPEDLFKGLLPSGNRSEQRLRKWP
jgi:hypothetical protein